MIVLVLSLLCCCLFIRDSANCKLEGWRKLQSCLYVLIKEIDKMANYDVIKTVKMITIMCKREKYKL